MKQHIVKVLFSTGLLLSGACTSFDTLNDNPDKAGEVTPSMIVTEVEKGTFRFWNPNASDYSNASQVGGYTAVIQDAPMGNQYYAINPGGFDNFKKLTDLKKMVEFSEGKPGEASYKGFALFYKAYIAFYYSLDFGDIPYSEAGKLDEGIMYPKYDRQEAVFDQILADLKRAEELFAEGQAFEGDFMMEGDADKWRRLCNALQLKVLQTQSKKATAEDKARFAEIVAGGNLMRSVDDNFQVTYTKSLSAKHPYYQGEYKQPNHAVAKMVVDLLKKWKDRRLFYFAEPAPALLAAGKSESDFDAYEGAPTEEDFETLKANKLEGAYSLMNMRYTKIIDGDPKICFSYAEQCFIIAEAIESGWVEGDSEEYYKNGVRAMLAYYMNGTSENVNYVHGMPIDQAYIDGYFDGENAYPTDRDARLQLIWEQRWMVDFFQATEMKNYYQLLRTGYPKLPLNPETSMNQDNKNDYPKRLKYPLIEQETNLENLQKAIDEQYGGVDNSMGVPWYLKD